MYIFKNAWISIERNKGRNILIGIIILVIACAASITLAIHNTANNLIESYKSSYNKEATIVFNRENMMKSFNIADKGGMSEAKNAFDNIASYTVEDVINYADSDYINDYYYTYQISLNGSSIEKVSSDFSFGEMGGKRGGMETQIQIPDFTIIGYNNINNLSEFVDGTYKMTEITEDAWEKIFTGNYVFINSELAILNGINLNDTITLTDNNNEYEFIVVGIYEEDSNTTEIPTNMFSNSANTIITSADYLMTTLNNDGVIGTITPTFILKNYEDAQKFQNELYEKGLDTNYVIQTNEEEAQSKVSSISNVSTFATSFLIVTLLIGAVVLFVINMINIRERKYEIGVMRTIGVSKLKLTGQFVFELFIVSLFAIIIGAGIGTVSSKSVGNYLLKNEIESSSQVNDKIAGNMMGGQDFRNDKMTNMKGNINGVTNVQAIDTMDAVVNFTVLLELIGVGLLLVLISSLAAMISIERFSPLTILKERS